METKAGTPNSRNLAIPLLLASVALALFSFNLDFPRTVNFDEFHYIPSAKQFLALTENQNYEHPPLAKELIAIGVGLVGDNPVGWRIMSMVFGVLTLLGMHRLALVLFESPLLAACAAILTLFNQLLYVQSRIAMLDTFMMAFLAWGWALGLEGWRALDHSPKRGWRLLGLGGACMGLAAACKWFALIPWAAVLALAAWSCIMEPRRRAEAGRIAGCLLLVPIAAYYVTFLPFLWIPSKATGQASSLWDILFLHQWRMWDGQMRVVSPHPYGSQWWEWPLMARPMWYAFDRESSPVPAVRGVMLLGNPMVLWGGMVALVWAAWDWIQTRNSRAPWIVGGWLVCYLAWVVIPRKLAFFYYYYPAAMLLGLALTHLLQRLDEERAAGPRLRWLPALVVLGTTVALFIYFFPILAALPIGPDEFVKWMWLPRWI